MGLGGVSWVADALKGHPAAKRSAPDSRDEQIKELNTRIAQLEAKPTIITYELRVTACARSGSIRHWLNVRRTHNGGRLEAARDYRQGCQYQDWAFGEGATGKDYLAAECQLSPR